jgi:hypothetical protein
MADEATDATPEKHAWAGRWLHVFRDTGNVRLACHAVGIERSTAYRHRAANLEFAKAWKDAEEDACDLLEAEARSRARKSSDTLMIFLLKAHRPEKYREKVTIEHLQRFAEMTDDELNDYIAKRLIAAPASGADSAGDAAVQAAGSDAVETD